MSRVPGAPFAFVGDPAAGRLEGRASGAPAPPSPRQAVTPTPLAIHAHSADALDAADGVPTHPVSVDADGEVGIGTTSPVRTLHVQASQPAIALPELASAANQSGYLSFRNDVSLETAWLGLGTAGSPHCSIVDARAGGSISLEAITLSPSVAATGGPYNAHTNGVSTISAGIRIMNGSGTHIDDAFDFIAIGPR